MLLHGCQQRAPTATTLKHVPLTCHVSDSTSQAVGWYVVLLGHLTVCSDLCIANLPMSTFIISLRYCFCSSCSSEGRHRKVTIGRHPEIIRPGRVALCFCYERCHSGPR